MAPIYELVNDMVEMLTDKFWPDKPLPWKFQLIEDQIGFCDAVVKHETSILLGEHESIMGWSDRVHLTPTEGEELVGELFDNQRLCGQVELLKDMCTTYRPKWLGISDLNKFYRDIFAAVEEYYRE